MASTVRKNSWGWTGMGDSQVIETPKINVSTPYVPPEPIAAAPKPEPTPYVPIKYTPVSASLNGYTEEQIREYSDLASIVGVSPADLKVEEFKAYLSTVDFPVYDLVTVIAFMDDKSKAEGRGWGWNWVPLREKDRITSRFGQPATRREMSRMWGGDGNPSWVGEDRPASDYYSSPEFDSRGNTNLVSIYNKVVPMHALKKIAKIEKEFKGDVAFMVSDYAPAPAFKADPFLMAVVNNSRLATGEGRFVIDVWDDPGFGIDKMLKSGL